ncbi:hypothetical protein P4668_25420 [Priestia megaterium]|uniref:hypothetical protein n=1 Tax=Priestia megaterium TaxID=1404 RepID=UPI002E22F7BC|nr:hypothetical protein [Priestia megaterium]
MFSREMIMLYGVILTFLIGLLNFLVSIKSNKRTVFVNAITSERVKWMGELKELLAEYLSLTSFYEKKPFLSDDSLSEYFERLIFLQNRIKLHLNYIDHKDEEINTLIEKINEKIFGIYTAKDIYSLPIEKRIRALSPEEMQGYFDKVLNTGKFSRKEIEEVLFHENREKLTEVFSSVTDELNRDFKEKYGLKGKEDLIKYTNQLVDKSRIYLKDEWEKVKKEAKKGKVTKKKKAKKKWFFRKK